MFPSSYFYIVVPYLFIKALVPRAFLEMICLCLPEDIILSITFLQALFWSGTNMLAHDLSYVNKDYITLEDTFVG